MTEVVENEHSFTNNRNIPVALCSTETFIRVREEALQQPMSPTPSTAVDGLPSIFSDDINRWFAGDNSAQHTTSDQSRVRASARSSVSNSPSLLDNGIWYTLAMILPLMGYGNPGWRCTPSFVLATGEILASQFASFCERTRNQFRSLAHDQVVREIFATAMDIVLIIYAIGFLVLSICQSSVHAAN